MYWFAFEHEGTIRIIETRDTVSLVYFSSDSAPPPEEWSETEGPFILFPVHYKANRSGVQFDSHVLLLYLYCSIVGTWGQEVLRGFF